MIVIFCVVLKKKKKHVSQPVLLRQAAGAVCGGPRIGSFLSHTIVSRLVVGVRTLHFFLFPQKKKV